VTVLPVTKGPAQCGDVHAQVDFLNHRPWPDLSDQFVFADHRAGVLDQHLQNIQGPSAQAQRLIAFHDQALIQMEREGPKCSTVSPLISLRLFMHRHLLEPARHASPSRLRTFLAMSSGYLGRLG
jgi:hypothetical protein